MKKTPASKRKKLIFVSLLGVLALFVLVALLENRNIINLYNKNNSIPYSANPTPITGQEPADNIDYSPATSTDNEDINAKKADGTVDQSQPAPAPTEPIEITLSAAGQDTKGGPVIVRTILGKANGGSCNLILKKGAENKSYTSEVIWSGTYYTCEGFSVPFEDLSAGSWELKLSVNQGDKSGEIARTISVADK